MSEAGNADASFKEVGRKYLWVPALALSYGVAYPLIYNFLLVAKAGNPYIGYEVSLAVVALYVASLLVMIGAAMVYLLKAAPQTLNSLLTSSLVFAFSNYVYVYSVLIGRPDLTISPYPFLLMYRSSSRHVSIGIDLGQIALLVSAIIIFKKVRKTKRRIR